MDSLHDHAHASAVGELSRFRREFYASLTARADALFELTDAVLCAGGPVTSLVELTLVAEHRRGHGAMYDALNQGRVEPERLRRTLVSLPLPRAADGRIVLAVDVSPWLRPDAPTSAERLFCHVHGRARTAQLIPGWPNSFVAALETGRTSWLPRRACLIDHTGEPPIIEGTLIRLQVEHLPGDRDPKPVWLWTSITAAAPADVDRWWRAFLRRFDLNTPFDCSSRPSAGPPRRSAPRPPPTPRCRTANRRIGGPRAAGRRGR
jgi:hypothetical protein